jgi:plasmid stabilization system protein ParE
LNFKVLWSASARADLLRLHEFLLDRATSLEQLSLTDEAVDAVEHAAMHQLGRTPFIFRRAGPSVTTRELIIPFSTTGYVARYEIVGNGRVVVLAVRHQLEEDFL